MSVTDLSATQRAALEIQLRSTPWKVLVKRLKAVVVKQHEPLELPVIIRRWLEVNRGTPRDEAEAAHVVREAEAIQNWVNAQEANGEGVRWFENKVEVYPISGWIISLAHALKDGRRWWILTAQRHDDRAPLVGSIVPVSASPSDLKKLGKIVAYAGGDPKRELLRTGAITHDEREDLLAAGKPEIAAYGQIFYWWRA